MRYSYDLHIHSALSPCADTDMTPNNIVNMSLLKGLDIIAVTDHNSCGNVRAVMEVASDNLLVIPGMEIETSEEVHVVCYFPTIEAAENAEKTLRLKMQGIKNRAEIFGNQYYMNAKDEIIGEEETLLVSATELDIYQTFMLAKEFGGIAVPAHIDRTSYSVISNLGFIPPDLGFTTVEITKLNLEDMKGSYSRYKIISNSDAHYLENISEPENFVDISDKTTKNLIDFLCKRE